MNDEHTTLTDIRDIHVNTDLPKEERIRDYLRQTGGDGRTFKYKDYTVIVRFAETDVTLQDKIAHLLQAKQMNP